MRQRATTCAAAATWISLSLDGELSELELAALTRHLDGCAACRELASRFARVSSLLRSEPPVEPGRMIVVPVRVSRARPVWRGVGAAAAVAAAVAATLVVSRGGGVHSSALGFGSAVAQQRFAHVHLETEPRPFTQPVLESTLQSYAGRVLR